MERERMPVCMTASPVYCKFFFVEMYFRRWYNLRLHTPESLHPGRLQWRVSVPAHGIS